MIRFDIWSPQRRNRRNVDIYLPTAYAESRKRYPVVYMQDGQNLSDPSTAFAGTWRLPEVLDDLEARGVEAIVVGLHNTRARLTEYSPFPERRHGGGGGSAYVSFVARTVKPRIDRQFRTRRTAPHTVIAGSSMGGLISLYAWLSRPGVFGHAVVMSPSLWYGRDRLFEFVQSSTLPRGRLHLDVGTDEGAAALRDARALKAILDGKGIDDRLSYLEDRGGRHEEAAWSRRLADAVAFALDGENA